MNTSPHNPQPGEKRGTDLVYKPVAPTATPPDYGAASYSTQPVAGGLHMTLGPVRDADNGDVHKSLSTAARFPAQHTPVPHELRNALATSRTLCNQLEIANRQVELRVALWLREQILLALLEVEGYVELVDPSAGSGTTVPGVLEVEA